MEIADLNKNFLYFPLEEHFEQKLVEAYSPHETGCIFEVPEMQKLAAK
jgi:hypothetical protein